jgi:hypothetical protein
MEVTVLFDEESDTCSMTTFGSFGENMTVYDIKKRI